MKNRSESQKHQHSDEPSFGGSENEDIGRNLQEVDKSEGALTKRVEKLSTTISSGTFLTTAVGAMAASSLLQVYGKKEAGQFIGQWVPTILIMGMYNKLVKLHGSEDRNAAA